MCTHEKGNPAAKPPTNLRTCDLVIASSDSQRHWTHAQHRAASRRRSLEIDEDGEDAYTHDIDVRDLSSVVSEAIGGDVGGEVSGHGGDEMALDDMGDIGAATTRYDASCDKVLQSDKFKDALIDRTVATWARAWADGEGAPLPHGLHLEDPTIKCAYGGTWKWTMFNRIHEPLPNMGRLCASTAGEIAALCTPAWGLRAAAWVSCALTVTHLDLEYTLRMMRANAEAPPLRAGQATTRVTLPSVFTEPEIPRFIRQVYSWRQEPSRKLSSGRRQPLQAGLLCKTVRDLVLGILVPPEPLAAGTLHAWATGGHLQESADLRASLLIRFLFFAKVLLDDVSISYSPAFKQGCVDLLRSFGVVNADTPEQRLYARNVMERLRYRVGPSPSMCWLKSITVVVCHVNRLFGSIPVWQVSWNGSTNAAQRNQSWRSLGMSFACSSGSESCLGRTSMHCYAKARMRCYIERKSVAVHCAAVTFAASRCLQFHSVWLCESDAPSLTWTSHRERSCRRSPAKRLRKPPSQRHVNECSRRNKCYNSVRILKNMVIVYRLNGQR